jgi:hypothetical protein
MTEDRREDHTWTAIRQNWPILIVVALLIAGGVRTEMAVIQLQDKMGEVEKLLNREAFTKFAVEQTNMKWRVKNLEDRAK